MQRWGNAASKSRHAGAVSAKKQGEAAARRRRREEEAEEGKQKKGRRREEESKGFRMPIVQQTLVQAMRTLEVCAYDVQAVIEQYQQKLGAIKCRRQVEATVLAVACDGTCKYRTQNPRN